MPTDKEGQSLHHTEYISVATDGAGDRIHTTRKNSVRMVSDWLKTRQRTLEVYSPF